MAASRAAAASAAASASACEPPPPPAHPRALSAPRSWLPAPRARTCAAFTARSCATTRSSAASFACSSRVSAASEAPPAPAPPTARPCRVLSPLVRPLRGAEAGAPGPEATRPPPRESSDTTAGAPGASVVSGLPLCVAADDDSVDTGAPGGAARDMAASCRQRRHRPQPRDAFAESRAYGAFQTLRPSCAPGQHAWWWRGAGRASVAYADAARALRLGTLGPAAAWCEAQRQHHRGAGLRRLRRLRCKGTA